MQDRQGETIPESPRPVHDHYHTAKFGEHPFMYEASWGRETNKVFRLWRANRAENSGDQCKEAGIALPDVERINMIWRQMHVAFLFFRQILKVGI